VLVADDEVAVAHAPAEYGYAAMSVALVNIRDGLARAVKRGVIDERTRARLVDLARVRFYRERMWSQLYDDARAAGIRSVPSPRWPRGPIRIARPTTRGCC
jgi:hypothetical protein